MFFYVVVQFTRLENPGTRRIQAYAIEGVGRIVELTTDYPTPIMIKNVLLFGFKHTVYHPLSHIVADPLPTD